MTRTCHIVCAGPCTELDIDRKPDDYLIAADGGYAHCIAAGLKPDVFIGDMDSLLDVFAKTMTCECIKLPVEKDDTDTIAACKLGLERGYAQFIIHAALGGDAGHELANIQTLAFLHSHEARGELRGETQRVYLVVPENAPMTFKTDPGTRVSVLAFGGPAHGVDEIGLFWELINATLTSDMPLGVSNKTAGDEFTIGLRDGALLVIVG